MPDKKPNEPPPTGGDRLHETLALTGPEHARKVYGEWAEAYDEHVAQDLGYGAPELVAEALARHIADPAGPLLDAGCGTGLAGEALRRFGQWPLYGLDISPEMLARARAKGLYAGLAAADLGRPLPVRANCFAGAVSSGTFAPGHVGAGAIAEIMRTLRSGAPFAVTVHREAWESGDFQSFLDTLQSGAILDLAELEEHSHLANFPGHSCMLCVAIKR
jgi:SAM-dependent methyltransferase